MHVRPILGLIAVAGIVGLGVAPPASLAQTSLALHGARAPEHGSPWLYGGTLGVSSSGIGIRAGGAGGKVATPAFDAAGEMVWVADADIVLAPTRWGSGGGRRGGSGGIAPYVFAGVGMQSRAGEPALGRALPHWSWGGGVAIPLIASTSLVGEARTRTLFDVMADAAISPGGRATEVLVGLELRFGGSSGRRERSRTGSREADRTRRPIATIPGRGPTSRTLGTEILPTARRYLGVKYRYGGTSPATGFDCSGFVQYVFARHDVRVPRTSRQQAGAGVRVEPRVGSLRPGDLMFFAENGSRISHVAIYTGENRIIHSTSSGGTVRYDDLSSPRGRWFATRLVAARRMTGSGAELDNLVRALNADGLDVKRPELDVPDRAPRPD